MEVNRDFPGGSGEVVSIDQKKRQIRLEPTKHKDLGWECWWYVKITGITPGETLVLDVGESPWATPDRAAFSTDHEKWVQTKPGMRLGKRIQYQQRVDTKQAWFAWGPPFVRQDATERCKQAAKKCRHARSFELCKSHAGRVVPALRVSEPGAPETERFGIWVQARQHAWESGSSWVAAGFVDWLVSDDPRASALRKQADITVIPIFAVDNVEIGAGGKEQIPHDHNRDWGDEPRYNAVATSIKEIKALRDKGRFDLFVDIHNASGIAKDPFYFVPPRELLGDLGSRNFDWFLAVSREEMKGPLKFRGEVIETGPLYDKDRWQNIAKNWVCLNTPEHVVSVTLEAPWNTADCTTSGYLALGEQLGLSMERYFRRSPREKLGEK